MSETTLDSSYFLAKGDSMAWLVCLSAGLFFMYEFFQLNIFDVINQPLRQDFHINATELSWMSSAYLWADILFLLPAGLILDKYSTRKVILIALTVCVLGTLGFASTTSFALAAFFHFLSGIGNAFCFLSCVMLVSRWFPPKRQALVIGSVVTMAFIGGMLAHTPFAYLYKLYGWRTALLIDGAVGALLLLWIYRVVQDQPRQLALPIRKIQGSGFKKALSNPQNWLAGAYTSLLNLPIMVLCALWGASYLEVVHRLSPLQASNVVSMIFVGSIVGCPLIGWASDTLGRRKLIMIIGALATLFTIIPLFLAIAFTPVVLSLIFFVLGFFTSTQVISYPLIAESNQRENTGSATGIASVIIMGGGGMGQIVFGWVLAHHAGPAMTHYSMADFQFALWMFPIAAMAALFAVCFSKETYCKQLLDSPCRMNPHKQAEHLCPSMIQPAFSSPVFGEGKKEEVL